MNRWHGSTIDGSAAAQTDGTAADTHDIRELYPNDYGEITGESLDMYLEAAEQSRKQAHDYANGEAERPDENVWRYWASRDGLTDPAERQAEPVATEPIVEETPVQEPAETPVETPAEEIAANDGRLPRGANADAATIDPKDLPESGHIANMADAWGEVTRVEVVGQNADGTTRVKVWFKNRPNQRGIDVNVDMGGTPQPPEPPTTPPSEPTGSTDDQRMNQTLDETLGSQPEVDKTAADYMPMENKGGGRMSPNWEKATAEQVVNYVLREDVTDSPRTMMEERVRVAQERVEKIRKERPFKGDARTAQQERKLSTWQNRLDKAEQQLGKMRQAESALREELIARQRARGEEEIRNRQTIAQLTDTVSGHVDEMDLADYVAYQIGTGKSKLKWKDQEKGSGRTHGLGGHLGLSGSSAERKARRAFIDDKNGMWPEEYAELLYANMPEGLRARYSDRDVLNAVLDVMRGASSRVGIMQDLASRWGSGETLEQRIERERDEWDRQQEEDMREQQEVDEQMRRNDVAATEGAEAVVDADYADLIADAQARLNDPNASEFEKQAARAVLRFRQRDGRGGASAQGTEGDDVRFRIRTKEPPKKTRKVYKLMRLGEDGKLYPLFIDSASPVELGTWYDADSPNLDFLKTLTAGVHLVNAETGESMTLEQFSSEHPELKIRGSNPNAAAIDWATANGMRWMKVVSKDRGQRRYGGELRSYYNYGINGSGAVETYALRPGWHAGSLPTMRQIGKGPNKNLRDNRFVWVEGEVAADVDYQGEADANPDKDIPDRIPEDGYYLKATNADKTKSQADRVGWFVSGAFKANRIISDAEARRVIDQWNAEHPDQKVEYDYERESGVEFSEADAARVNGGEKATTIERGRNIAEREVANVMIDSAKYPRTKEAVIAQTPAGGKLCHNEDQDVDVRVGRNTIRHALMHGTSDEIAAMGGIDEIIAEAVKIGNIPVAEDELGHTRSVSIYYTPVSVDGRQYSARMVIKELENRGRVLDELSLYHVAMHKAKNTNSLGVNASQTSGAGVNPVGVQNRYKVKELIHSTQEGDRKLLGIGSNSPTLFRVRGDDERRPTFYSNAERAVENVKQGKATAEQWKAMLTKAGGIKAGEDKWMGLTDWLDEHKGQSLTKDEVLQFVRDNGIRMEEVNYGGDVYSNPRMQELQAEYRSIYDNLKAQRSAAYDEAAAFNNKMVEKYGTEAWHSLLDEGDKAQHQQMVDDFERKFGAGLDDAAMREMTHRYGDDFASGFDGVIGNLRVGYGFDGIPVDEAKHYLGDINPIESTRELYTTRGLENKREIAFVVDGIEPYQQGDAIHFGPENGGKAVMWVRFGETRDTDGKRVLVIDEVQSNRHQNARERGYRSQRTESRDYKFQQAADALTAYRKELEQKYGEFFLSDDLTEAETKRYEELRAKLDEADAMPKDEKDYIVPDAPFEKNWMEVAMKRMLRLAAEEGFDKVAWTTGAQQAERYGIGGVVESITKGKTRGENTLVSVQYKNGKHDSWVVAPDGKVVDGGITTGENLSDLIGKELSEKVMSLDENGSISGDGLRIGGAGMSGFYDQIVPSFMRKYVKKWGSQVGEVELATPGGEVMHSVDVTDPMRDSVMQGQPLFRVRDEARQYDEQNGTELSRFVEFLERGRRLLDGENNHFHVGNTGDILNRFGISGKITVSTTAVNKRHTNDSDHLTTEEWVKAISNINNPLAITKYGNQGKSFRIYTLVQKNGKNICVGVDVNNVGRDVNVTNVRTAFARDIVNALNESLLYPSRGELERAIQEFSSRHNREIYPEQPLSGSKGSDNSSISKINEEKTTGNGVNYRVRDGHEAAVEDARRRLESDDASEFERQAARTVIKAYGGDTPDGGGPHFRMREPQKAIEDDERAVNSSGFQVTEALQDSMMGLKKLMQAIVGKDAKGKGKAIQDIAGFENAYLKENRLQSESVAQVDEYRTKYYSPLVKAVSALCPTEAPCVSVAPYPI